MSAVSPTALWNHRAGGRHGGGWGRVARGLPRARRAELRRLPAERVHPPRDAGRAVATRRAEARRLPADRFVDRSRLLHGAPRGSGHGPRSLFRHRAARSFQSPRWPRSRRTRKMPSGIVPMLDARRGEVYSGLYAPHGNQLQEDRVTDPGSWVRSLTDTGDRLHFLGSGALRYAELIEAAHGDRACILSADQARPRAASVGVLGARLAEAGGSLPAPEVELRYLRRPQAEVSRSAGHSPAEPIT